MKIPAYILISKDRELSIFTYKPSVSSNQVLLKLNLDVPDSMFDTPVMSANIVVKEPSAGTIKTIEIDGTEVLDWLEKS